MSKRLKCIVKFKLFCQIRSIILLESRNVEVHCNNISVFRE